MGKLFRLLSVVIISACLISFPAMASEHQVVYENETTGYIAVIDDRADLLQTRAEWNDICDVMKLMTDYADVIFATTSVNDGSARDFAKVVLDRYAVNSSRTAFVIDMDNREIYIFSKGKVYKTITARMAETIADNTYTFATNGQYADCAVEVFLEELTLLEGGRIARPMKYVSNFFMALMLSVLALFAVMRVTHVVSKPKDEELLSAGTSRKVVNRVERLTKSVKTRHSDGGGSGGGGFGGGGGGGHGF